MQKNWATGRMLKCEDFEQTLEFEIISTAQLTTESSPLTEFRQGFVISRQIFTLKS